jgi:hypothetical protein
MLDPTLGVLVVDLRTSVLRVEHLVVLSAGVNTVTLLLDSTPCQWVLLTPPAAMVTTLLDLVQTVSDAVPCIMVALDLVLV